MTKNMASVLKSLAEILYSSFTVKLFMHYCLEKSVYLMHIELKQTTNSEKVKNKL
jgi:hypothetical protein